MATVMADVHHRQMTSGPRREQYQTCLQHPQTDGAQPGCLHPVPMRMSHCYFLLMGGGPLGCPLIQFWGTWASTIFWKVFGNPYQDP